MHALPERFLPASAVLVLLVGCTGSSDTPEATVFARAQPAGAMVRSPVAQLARQKVRAALALAAAQAPSAREFLDWAEDTYPELFPRTPQQPVQVFETYLYRYYPMHDWLLAVNEADGAVLGYLNVKGTPQFLSLGTLSGFTCSVFPSRCAEATPVVFDKATVASGSSELSAFMNVCDPAAPRSVGLRKSPATPRGLPSPRQIQQTLALNQAASGRSARTYTGTPPADKLGECGGRMSYISYSHVSGVTQATREFSDYCMVDSDTGEHQTINGRMSFVNLATPTTNGPITTQFTAQSPEGLRFNTRNSAGATLTSQTYRFTNYVLTPGVPGGSATPGSPDRVEIEELVSTNNLTGKAYRQTGYTLSFFDTADGGSQASLSGRGYRSNGQYYDLTSSSPIVTNEDGDYVSGVFTFTGANGSSTVATVVPGSSLQTTLSVDGEAVTGLPACAP